MLPLVINSDPNRLNSSDHGGLRWDRWRQTTGQMSFHSEPVESCTRSAPRRAEQAIRALDGLVGPQTIAAIQRFQKAKTRFADGRIDVNGPTVMALVTYLHERQLLPARMPQPGSASS